jgi:hypothetical protein
VEDFGGPWRGVFGGARGSRTPDLLNAIQALSQLSYGPNLAARFGAPRLSLLTWQAIVLCEIRACVLAGPQSGAEVSP